MLYLYNLQRKKISALENAYDIIENQKINQVYSLSFKMLKNDLKSERIQPFYFVRWESKEETSDFYQIIKKNLNYSNIDSLTFECQHVINLLSQKSLPTQTISGTISQCINKILSYQNVWKLISSDFSQSFIYFFGCFFTLFTMEAHAYIDPSVVTYIIQGVAGVLITLGAVFTIFRHKIFKFFKFK